MSKFIVTRVMCERWEWVVEADNILDALAQLDDDTKTPSLEARVEWMGPSKAHMDEALELDR